MQAIEANGNGDVFPFRLEDLLSWTVRRTDGSVAVFQLAETTREAARVSGAVASNLTDPYWNPRMTDKETTSIVAKVVQKLSPWCSHTPNVERPVAVFPNREGGELCLFVGDQLGAGAKVNTFDFVIDGGNVISDYLASSVGEILSGDRDLVDALRPFILQAGQSRILKVMWTDREAPDVDPEFWVELNKHLVGDVMTCCQGGHGRSGTALVCLLLVNALDYDAKDAIVHLRANHCPRAIESAVQHAYIDDVARFLGREPNAIEVKGITDYKAAFAKSEKPTAVKFREFLAREKK